MTLIALYVRESQLDRIMEEVVMFDRLEDILMTYEEIEEELLNPNVVNDQEIHRKRIQE